MKQIIIAVLLAISSLSLKAQASCDCQQELNFVYEKMQEMVSFKSQVKGAKKKEFTEKYHQISAELRGQLTQEECFWKLNGLMSFVKDEHALFYGAKPDFDFEDVQDSAFVQAYRKTSAFVDFPRSNQNLSKLEVQLSNKSLNSIEGIYQVGSGFLNIGVYRTQKADSLVGVVLDSKLGTWEPGQMFLYMKEKDKERQLYDIMTYSQVHKNLLFYRNRWVSNYRILSNMKKIGAPKTFNQVDAEHTEEYQLKRLSDEVQYVWINSFSRIGNAQKRDGLIEQIEQELTADHLIIDLRNNGGGASKISKPILKAIKKHSDAKVYVLTNYQSGSNAEQTTIRLRKQLNAIHMGERTRGAIAYGVNYGTSYASPTGLFKLMPTDMKFNKWLKYEQVGIQPEIQLDSSTDWIVQTLAFIDNSH